MIGSDPDRLPKLPLTRIAEAHSLMDTSAVAGKIVLVPDSSG
jgi:hypothetical protein